MNEQVMRHGTVVAIVADRGVGKTLFGVHLAKQYDDMGINVFTNIELYNIGHRIIEFKDISSFPDWLRDGIIIMDEMHVGADSYAFLRNDVQQITNFITQIRKRNLSFVYITQNFTTIVKRLRQQTNYMYLMEKIMDGVAEVTVHDLMHNYKIVNKFPFDGRHLYNYYNTYQIIS